jgi:type VI secretion system protein ImpH
MAPPQGTTAEPLVADLLRNPRRYEFYQAVRILEASAANATSVGWARGPDREAVRFRANPSFGFPSADIESVEKLDSKDRNLTRYQLTVNFIGLCGVSSPLPSYYTEDILQRDSDASAQQDFYDFFHHRLISLLYRIWVKYRYHMQYRQGASDRLSAWLSGLARLDDALRMQGLASGGRSRLLPCLGLLLMRSISPSTLSRILSFYFHGLPVRIAESVERYVIIERDQLNQLGQANSTLADDCVIGDRIRDVGGKFRICIGPLNFATFAAFLPGRPALHTLHDLASFAVRDPLEFDLELTLLQSEIPELTLEPDCSCELGWSTWLGLPPQDGVVIASTLEMQVPSHLDSAPLEERALRLAVSAPMTNSVATAA